MEQANRRQVMMNNQGIVSQQREKDKAIAAEERRKRKKREKQMQLENDTTYVACRFIYKAMDTWCLDPIIGFFFPGVADLLTQVLIVPFLYAAIFKVHSFSLTLAMIYNSMVDILKGSIPIIGDIWDIFSRSHAKNYKLLVGYVEDDEAIIDEVHKSATKCIIGICVISLIVYYIFHLTYMFFQYMSDLWQQIF